jgi:hypothetical protein
MSTRPRDLALLLRSLSRDSDRQERRPMARLRMEPR